MRPLRPDQKVFGVGLGRTGTTSLTKALELLGVSTKHYPSDERTYEQLRAGDFRLELLERYQGVTDIPVAPHFAHFDVIYPDSKFILTVRDEVGWLTSMREHARLIRGIEDPDFARFAWRTAYGVETFDAERLLVAYRAHVARAKAHFEGRADDFLVLDIVGGEGWEKLSPFLGRPMPSTPFPHANTTQEDDELYRRSLRSLDELSTIVAEGESFVFVDGHLLGYQPPAARRALPFLEREGRAWGYPRDDAVAVAELERMRAEGARFIVFPWLSFWWFEHYAGLARHLNEQYDCTLQTEDLAVFDLRGRRT